MKALTRLNESCKPLTQRLRAEGPVPALVDELVNKHLELAILKSRRRWNTPAWIRDEMYVFCLEEIYKGIKRAARLLTDDNLTFFLAAWLNRNVRKQIYRQMNNQSWDSAHAKDGRKNWTIERHEFKDEHKLIFTEPEENLYLTIISLCKTPQELQVVELLRSGLNGYEIAEQLELSKSRIYLIRDNLYQRYKEYVREETSDAIGRADNVGTVQVGPSDASRSIHASCEAGSPTDSVVAMY